MSLDGIIARSCSRLMKHSASAPGGGEALAERDLVDVCKGGPRADPGKEIGGASALDGNTSAALGGSQRFKAFFADRDIDPPRCGASREVMGRGGVLSSRNQLRPDAINCVWMQLA
jgi:hypothetical protein